MTINCVLFDLDGTLVDTAPDLGAALNRLLAEDGRPPLDAHVMRPCSSKGARGLLKLGYGIEQEDEDYGDLRDRYLKIYAANICNSSQLFKGMPELLTALVERDITWGVVTNKPAWLANPLMAALDFPSPAACIVGGDQVPKPKPDPAALELACELIDLPAERCIYVGDAKRDIVAGKRAGMQTIAVSYGYIEDGDAANQWGADWVIDSPLQILDCLAARAA